ncbi:MAG: glycerophosphodiester phosphodiesterase family protein [Hyphomicrobiaceae bacterium]
MFDRAAFVRPIAHRGLHDVTAGVIENSAPAFEAAIAHGYGIECDLQPASDGSAVVFHDHALQRLVEAPGRTSDHAPDALAAMRYRDDPSARILRLGDFLGLVAGRVPILIEVKTSWSTPDPRFMAAIARDIAGYRGPCALMSFDPTIIAALKPRLPNVPRGIVSGVYTPEWSEGRLDDERSWRLTNLIESGPAAPHFFAYHVKSLPTAVTRFLREGLGIALFAWTVRSAEDLATARAWADAPIFESVDPRM